MLSIPEHRTPRRSQSRRVKPGDPQVGPSEIALRSLAFAWAGLEFVT
jgi:hypothetical protein